MYGRGAASVAEQIHSTPEEAQGIIDNFYKSFPKVKKWIDDSKEFAYKHGYVEDFYGRRRRLPDIQLPKYTITDNSANNVLFNPILGSRPHPVDSSKVKRYKELLDKCRSRRDVDAVKEKAEAENITIVNNSGFISQAERQCVNARIQGGAATMTKIAMNRIYRDKEIQRLGFRSVMVVHDEIIGECPEENAEAVGERLAYLMRTCVEDIVSVPFKCDATIISSWYEDEVEADVKEEAGKLLKKGKAAFQVMNQLRKDYAELSEEQLTRMTEGCFS